MMVSPTEAITYLLTIGIVVYLLIRVGRKQKKYPPGITKYVKIACTPKEINIELNTVLIL